MMPLRLIARLNGRTISNYRKRKEWQSKVHPANTVWAFYNNWGQLYYDQFHRPATTFYDAPWSHVSYRRHCLTGSVLLSPQHSAVYVHHCGSDVARYVTLIFGQNAKQHFIIPPGHILYVEMANGATVVSSHIQSQPLPCTLLPRVN